MQNTTDKVYLRLYTDASKYGTKSTAVSIIVDKFNYYGRCVTTLDNLDIASTEFLAIIQGVEHIRKLNLNLARVDIYTDVLQFKLAYNKMFKGEKVDSKYDFGPILELAKTTEICMHYFTAHQESNNLNKTCDILARIASKIASKGVT